MKKHTAQELNKLYIDADSIDRELFAEMRTNLLLVNGDHYTRKGSKFWNRIKDDKSLSSEQKIRLVKNHVQKITKLYSNFITTASPGVKIAPNNEKELADQKAAELHEAVWQYAKHKHNIDEKICNWSDDFVNIGEIHTEIVYDPMGGEFIGYEQEVDEMGQPVFETTVTPEGVVSQEPKASDKAVFSGSVSFKELHGFNVLRCPTATTLEESPYLIVRTMVDTEKLLAQYESAPQEIKEKLKENGERTFRVFEPQTGSYSDAKGQVMLKKFYFRACYQYPRGWWFFVVGEDIIDDGEIPFGIYPIISEPFDKIQTSPRGRSPVKIMRPFQIEINRCASSIAEAHLTLGQDKLIMNTGSKLSQGASVPGVRSLLVSGAPPTILPGRDGSQYVQHMASTIEELYRVMMVDEMRVEKDGQIDPFAIIFKSASQKQSFSRYIKGFERFLKKVCTVYLEMQRNYLSEQDIIPMISKREAVNISEFKNADKLCYQIKVMEQSDDIETKLGKQLVLNHLLQYGAGKLERADIGKLYRLMPYGNNEQLMGDMVLDYDNGTNIILALDRGKMPSISMYDDKVYMIKRLTSRMRQADYAQLHPQIQSMYEQVKGQYEQMVAQEQEALAAAKNEQIPTDGPLVGVDLYVSDPMDPTKTRRAKVPSRGLEWFVKRLEQQGSTLQKLEDLQQQNLAEIAQYQMQMGSSNNPPQMSMDANSGAPRLNGMSQGAMNGSDSGNTNSGNFDPRTIGAGTSSR